MPMFSPYIQEIRSNPLLLEWYDASQITGVADGARMDGWGDMSGNGWHLTKTNAGSIYRATGFNGYPCAEFNGSDTAMGATAEIMPHTEFTIIIVMTAWTGGRPIGLESDASGANGLGFYGAPAWITRNGGGSADLSVSGFNGSNPVILTLRMGSTIAGLSGTDSYTMQGSYAAAFSNTNAVWGSAGQNFHLGSSGNNSSLFGGKIAEFLSFRRVLTTSQLYRMFALLDKKYGPGLLLGGNQVQSLPTSTMPQEMFAAVPVGLVAVSGGLTYEWQDVIR